MLDPQTNWQIQTCCEGLLGICGLALRQGGLQLPHSEELQTGTHIGLGHQVRIDKVLHLHCLWNCSELSSQGIWCLLQWQYLNPVVDTGNGTAVKLMRQLYRAWLDCGIP